ncbi:MAG TPA: succinate-semialdehyde dehydrogenase (NADP(+)), partial [Rhodobiaceae bacterium]|nr:succinate-semialdehyde dehydrogenase (NADP(+)) [Rhodobiaceae bacterium]
MNLRDPNLLRTLCYIDGSWTGQAAAKTAVTNPATGEVIAEVPVLGRGEAEEAIDAAYDAGPAWAGLTAKERSTILRRWFDLMMENADDLALILTSEQGKPLAEAKGEITYAASFLEFYAEEAKRIHGSIVPAPSDDRQIVVL